MPRLFDAYIMVDWSAASSPKTGKDSIWIADLRSRTNRTKFDNPPTRFEAWTILAERLNRLKSAGCRTLLGFDFSFGYPAGTAKAIGLAGAPWLAMHDWLARKIEDFPDNSNNRFAVAAELNGLISGSASPFWGVTSQKHRADTLMPNKPDYSKSRLAEFRMVEKFARGHGLGVPKSGWQLAYIGSVGSQSLLGIPYVGKLRKHFPTSRVWPFETGFKTLTKEGLGDTDLVMAEIYPSLLNARPKPAEPLDKAQVRTMARHYWELDESGRLGARFAQPSGIKAVNLSNINNEEGWILGITPINIGNLAS